MRCMRAGIVLMTQMCAVAETLPETIGWHKAVYGADAKLMPWTSWDDVVARQMRYYLNCPTDKRGYPVFAYATFMNAQSEAYEPDIIPCSQDGMGILSYIK